ncbi:MAG: hypothetical protein QNJ75_05680 [Acidimicrobiia bacterium]|nr:hypothetical protein [Acidimicrobiia bacterium]
MLYINNPAALVAIEQDRRSDLGMHMTSAHDTTAVDTTAPKAVMSRSVRIGFRRVAPVRYAAS